MEEYKALSEGFVGIGEKIAESTAKLAEQIAKSTAALSVLPEPEENPRNVPKAVIDKRRRQNKAARKTRRTNRPKRK